MDVIKEYWHQIIFIGLAIVMFTKLREQTSDLRKDVNEIQRRELYAKFVQARAEIDIMNKQISSLWEFVNKMRDKFNGNK